MTIQGTGDCTEVQPHSEDQLFSGSLANVRWRTQRGQITNAEGGKGLLLGGREGVSREAVSKRRRWWRGEPCLPPLPSAANRSPSLAAPHSVVRNAPSRRRLVKTSGRSTGRRVLGSVPTSYKFTELDLLSGRRAQNFSHHAMAQQGYGSHPASMSSNDTALQWAGRTAGEGEGYGGHLRNNTDQSATHISITERDLPLPPQANHIIHRNKWLIPRLKKHGSIMIQLW